jgi:hypothetical protein
MTTAKATAKATAEATTKATAEADSSAALRNDNQRGQCQCWDLSTSLRFGRDDSVGLEAQTFVYAQADSLRE